MAELRDYLAVLLTWSRGLASRARALLFRERIAKEIETELALHLEMTIEQGVRDGLSIEQAEFEALRRFGDLAAIRRHCLMLKRANRRSPQRRREAGMFSQLLRDTRYAFRNLIKSPGFTAAAVATLALGIGANAAIFSVVDGVLLSPFPYTEASELVRVRESDRIRGTRLENFSGPDYFDLVERNSVFSGLAAFQSLPFTATGRDIEPARLTGTRITHTLFGVLGVKPELGRAFYPEEDVPGAEPLAILSHALWIGRFGSDPKIVDATMILDGITHRIVGVMPRGFQFPSPETDFWTSLRIDAVTSFRGVHNIGVVARLDETDIDTANANLETVAAALEVEFADENLGRGMWAQSLHESVVGSVQSPLFVLFGAVSLVLLIACVNVANLQLARGATRRREVSVRAAMGAGRFTLVRQFLTESLVLTLFGAVAGLGVAYLGVELLLALDPSNLPRLENVSVDGRVVAFTLVASVLSAILFGTLPSFQASSGDLQGALRETPRSDATGGLKQRVRQLLVVSEIAMAVMLVTGSALLIRSFWKLTNVDPGFHSEGVYSTSVELPASRYPQNRENWPQWTRVRNFQQELVSRVSELPNVRSAALAMNHPMDEGWTTRFHIEGREEVAPGEQEEVRIRVVSPDYFETMGIPVLQGRSLNPFDDRTDAPPVLLVNEAFARRYFGDDSEEPLMGARVRIWSEWREIVGIVRDVKFVGLDQDVPPAVYPTFSQMPFTAFSVLVRTNGDAESIAASLRYEVGELDGDLATTPLQTLDEAISTTVAQPRFNMMLLTVFALLALLLAAIGIYGVMAYGVSRRTREIGVRMSLGAGQSDVLRQFIGEGVRLASVGIVVGLVASILMSRILSSLLFGVGSWDPASFVAVCLVSAAVVTFSSWFPAWRASRTSPTTALRYE